MTGPLADALNWAGVSEEKFNEQLEACNSEQERQKLIMETLNGLYDDAADKYREVNGEVIAANEAQDRLTSVMADLGAAVEPIVTKGKELVAEVLEKAMPVLTDLAQVAIPFLVTAFEWVITALGATVQWFQDAYTWMKENETAVVLIGIALGTLAAALLAYQIAQSAATIATTIATAATAAWGAAVAFLTSPITLTIAAIGALIAIVYLLVKNWDTVKEAAGKAWDFIKQTWSKVAAWFDSTVIQPVKQGFSAGLEAVKNAFSKALEAVKSAWSGVKGFFSGIWDSIKQTFGSVTSWFQTTFQKAWTAVKNVFSTGGKIFDGIKEGIASTFKTIVNGIIGGINKVISVPFKAINKALQRIKNIEILKIKPFTWIPTISIPQIPKLERGAVLERGQVGLLEGNGAEAVVPLEKNKKWISAVAQDMGAVMGGNSQVVMLLAEILAMLEDLAQMRIYLDDDALVGGLAKKMDRKLGQLQAKKARA